MSINLRLTEWLKSELSREYEKEHPLPPLQRCSFDTESDYRDWSNDCEEWCEEKLPEAQERLLRHLLDLRADEQRTQEHSGNEEPLRLTLEDPRYNGIDEYENTPTLYLGEDYISIDQNVLGATYHFDPTQRRALTDALLDMAVEERVEVSEARQHFRVKSSKTQAFLSVKYETVETHGAVQNAFDAMLCLHAALREQQRREQADG